MMYQRNGRQTREVTPTSSAPVAKTEEKKVNFNGFGQVLEMLRVADDAFRESLLRRLAQQDPALARRLREELHGHR